MIRVLRRVWKRLRTWRPWIDRILLVLDLIDWKTWIWYTLLGGEKLTHRLLIWAKRRGYKPAHLVLKNGKFYVKGKPNRSA